MGYSPERPGNAQSQRLFSASAGLPLDLVGAATLLSYLTMRDAEDRDIPAAAAFFVRKNTDFFLGAVLLELALYGRIQLDEITPLENHAFYYEQKQKQQSLKGLLFVAPPVALFIAGIITYVNSLQSLSIILFLSFMAYILLTILLLLVRGAFLRGKTAEGKLGVVDTTPTGSAVLDEILRQMVAAGESRLPYRWLYGRGSLKADGLYKITERRLAEQGWITLTGTRRVMGLFEMETLVINRYTEQWQVLNSQVRSALLLGYALSPEMVALLLYLTLFGYTFYTPRHVRLPGQAANQKSVSSLYHFLLSPEELSIGRQRLQTLMRGDQSIAAMIGLPLYDVLLSIRNGIERSVEARKQTTSG